MDYADGGKEKSSSKSLNNYSYCLNNPLKYVDPSGHLSEEELAAMGIYLRWDPSGNNSLNSVLLRAEVGDQLTVIQNDGTATEYTFVDNGRKGIQLESENRFYSVSKVVEDKSNIELMLVSRETDYLDLNTYSEYNVCYEADLINDTLDINIKNFRMNSPKIEDNTINLNRVGQVGLGILEFLGGGFMVVSGGIIAMDTFGLAIPLYISLMYEGWGVFTTGINDIAGQDLLFEDYPLMW